MTALKALFNNITDDTGAAFVIIQHLDPTQESLTAEILARSTSMPVAQVDDGMRVEANHVYVIPPNAYLTLQKHSFRLGEAVLVNSLRMPIDTFLWSLAEQCEQRGIAIIISGTGSDGTLGVRAVKGNGGLVIAQKPETAQYDGMPRSAIATGLVDVVCPIETMGENLLHFLQHPYYQQSVADETDTPPDIDTSPINAILAVLHNRGGHDFRDYKQGTLQRRIARRMGLHHVNSMADCVNFLRRDDQKDEIALLFKDLLIGVTAFFRDHEAFAALQQKVIAPLVENKHNDAPIRVWVPGCASGEEAYSLSILLSEQLEAANKHCPIQIFATDIDEASLSIGRTGLYPQNIAASVSARRLSTFLPAGPRHVYRLVRPPEICERRNKRALATSPNGICCRNSHLLPYWSTTNNRC